MKTERFDIHQHITDRIIAAIECGAGEFRLPWHRSTGNIMRPVNIASKNPYRGVNVLALWATAEEKGYTAGIWGTYRQWSEAGAQIRKGEKSAYIVFYKEITVAADDVNSEETDTRLFARATPVFAAEQVEGWTPPMINAPATRRRAASFTHMKHFVGKSRSP
jgi:antirestriction protein ArdC